MRLYKGICNTLAKVTTLEEKYIVLLLTSLIVIIIFRILKVFGKKIIQKVTTGRKEFVSNQTYQVILNALEILVFILLFDDYIKGLMTLISVISAAMTISLRDFILNFFCGVYIKFKKPFKVEDRIQIEDIKGDVMSISTFSFEILEVSNKEDNGQSTGIVIHYPNSTIVSKPVKNINKGFKYIWNEMTIKVCLDCDLANNKKMILDQYSPLKEKFIEIEVDCLGEDSDVVIKYCDAKNIIYLNSPKKLEEFANELYGKLSLKQSDVLNKAAKDLREYVHDDYELANCVEKGIIYHHGSIPEQVRYFIESLYADVPELGMLIANSTLLEGVNIPATKMFILDPSRGSGYLSASSFKNLIGRVCRFGEIFNEKTGSLDYLMPEIHIIKGKYCRTNFNASSFVKGRKILVEDSDKIVDEINNPLLKNNNSEAEEVKKAEEILENISSTDSIIEEYDNKPKTKVGKLCFENSVSIFNIFEKEIQISEELKQIDKVHSLDTVFAVMDYLFFSKIDKDSGEYNNLKRLREAEAQKFYKMLINWRIIGFTIKDMVSEVVNYWNTLREGSQIVYVGKWGDKTRGGYKKYWTDISQKREYEKVNLAIVRLKEEYDFIDNEIVKYIEILHSLDLIEESFYLKIKYGTDNKEKIALLNCGISNTLTKLLKDKYKNLYEFDFARSTVIFSEKLIPKMIENNENGILISEVKMNSKE